jgi:hypothetical protein
VDGAASVSLLVLDYIVAIALAVANIDDVPRVGVLLVHVLQARDRQAGDCDWAACCGHDGACVHSGALKVTEDFSFSEAPARATGLMWPVSKTTSVFRATPFSLSQSVALLLAVLAWDGLVPLKTCFKPQTIPHS